MALQAFFLPVAGSRRFCLFHPAKTAKVRGVVLYLPPFTEEMNCLRQVAAAQARRLAEHGFSVLQLDYFGTGDSDGDLSEASWARWCEDVHAAIDWLGSASALPICLWGVRASCLLAAAVARERAESFNFLFWQPVVEGDGFLRQLLRLKSLNDLLAGRPKTPVDALLAMLASGQTLEVAGYALNSALTDAWQTAALVAPEKLGCLMVLEVTASSSPVISPALTPIIEAWRSKATEVSVQVVAGSPYWQKVGRVDTGTLDAATLLALQGCYS